MKDRFDLEQQINQLHNIADQLQQIINLQDQLTEDQYQNAIIGISELIRIQAIELDDTHCQIFKIDKYRQKTFKHIKKNPENISPSFF